MPNVTNYLEVMTTALIKPVVIKFIDNGKAESYRRTCYRIRATAQKMSMKGRNPMEDGYGSSPWDELLFRVYWVDHGVVLRVEKRTKEALGIVEEGDVRILSRM